MIFTFQIRNEIRKMIAGCGIQFNLLGYSALGLLIRIHLPCKELIGQMRNGTNFCA